MKHIFLVLILSISLLHANKTFEKELSSELRAEVYAQNLLEGGYNKDVNEFLIKALELYPANTELLMFRGTALFNLKDIVSAKKFFIRVLENDSTNEQASDFISLIEDQEGAQENEAIGDLIDYLGDKGLDFLIIFLAFLGGESIARKYNKCTSYETASIINRFRERKVLSQNFMPRIAFSLKQCCFSRTLFTFCFFLEVVVTLTIVFALLIVWLMIEFMFEISMFLNESLSLLTSDAIWNHAIDSFLYLGIITLILRFSMKVFEYDNKEDDYVIELAEQLEKLFNEQSYKRFYTALNSLSESDYKDIKYFMHNDDAKQSIERHFQSQAS